MRNVPDLRVFYALRVYYIWPNCWTLFHLYYEETFAWQSRYKRILCSMGKQTFLFTMHRLVKARNEYTAYSYQQGKRPVLPSARKT